MICFNQALAAWPSPAFKALLKQEIEQLDVDLLPLQQGLAQTSQVGSAPPRALILGVVDEPERLRVKVGLFYSGIIAGCSCADDPTPLDEINEYCEVRVDIDKISAEASITLMAD
jgi:hypothetical protein